MNGTREENQHIPPAVETSSTSANLLPGPLVVVDQVGHDYSLGKDTRTVLEGLSFSMNMGEFVCIVGPSGVGKSTMLKCIAGLQRPTRGSVHIAGKQLDGPSRDVGLVFQNYDRSLMPWLSVADNAGLALKGKFPRAQVSERVSRALDEVGLSEHRDKKPWQLSGGMQQRVAIARALAFGAPLLLMDEPFASVDAQTRAELEDLTLKVRNDTDQSVIFITHDIDEAVYMADRVLVLGGRPAGVVAEVPVSLGPERSHLTTKSLPEFAELRKEVYSLIQAQAKN